MYLCGPQRRQQNANTNRNQEKSNLHCHPGYEQPACAANTAGNQEQICQHRILEHLKNWLKRGLTQHRLLEYFKYWLKRGLENLVSRKGSSEHGPVTDLSILVFSSLETQRHKHKNIQCDVQHLKVTWKATSVSVSMGGMVQGEMP